MASTLDLLRRLTDCKVEFVIVGGLAGVFHGSSVVTQDLDLCAPLHETNLARMLKALEGLEPRWRMRPEHPRLARDPADLAGFKNLYLLTRSGPLDVLSENSGLGTFDDVLRQSLQVEVSGISCRVLTIDALIRSKRALGRPRDLQVVTELEAIRERRGESGTGPTAQ
jgi:hypothetical protein